MFTESPADVHVGTLNFRRDQSGGGRFTWVNEHDYDPWVAPPRGPVSTRLTNGARGRFESPEREYDYTPGASTARANEAMRRAFWRWCKDNGVGHGPAKVKGNPFCTCGLMFDSSEERDAHFRDMKELNEYMEARHGA